MEDGRLPKVAFRYRPFGTRDVGRTDSKMERYSVKTEQPKCLLREVQKTKTTSQIHHLLKIDLFLIPIGKLRSVANALTVIFGRINFQVAYEFSF